MVLRKSPTDWDIPSPILYNIFKHKNYIFDHSNILKKYFYYTIVLDLVIFPVHSLPCPHFPVLTPRGKRIFLPWYCSCIE